MQNIKKVNIIGKQFLLALLMLLILSPFCLFFSAFADGETGGETGEEAASAPTFKFIIAPDTKKEIGFSIGDKNYAYKEKDKNEYKTINWADSCKAKGWAKVPVHLIYYAEGGLFDSLADSDALKINNFDGDNQTSLWKIFWKVYDAFKIAGIGLALMWALLDIIEASTNQLLSGEYVLRLFIKFILAVFVMDYGQTFIKALLGLGNAIYDTVADAISLTSGNTLTLTVESLEEIVQMNYMECVSVMFEYVLIAIAMLVCFVLALTMILGRIFELGIRTAFAPIGISDLFIHGVNSSGMRYAKAFLACASQGAALILILRIGANLMNASALKEMLGNGTVLGSTVETLSILMPIIVAITTIGVMKRADSILQSVFS